MGINVKMRIPRANYFSSKTVCHPKTIVHNIPNIFYLKRTYNNKQKEDE